VPWVFLLARGASRKEKEASKRLEKW